MLIIQIKKEVPMKKALSLILTAVLIFSVIASGGITAFAESEIIEDGDYDYILLDDGTYELAGYYGSDKDLVLPSEFRGKPVTVLGGQSCCMCDELVSVVIPNTVTVIGEQCFKTCPVLESVTIPSSVKTIGSGAFSNCPNLSRVNIDDLAVWCETVFGDNEANPLYTAKDLYLNGSIVKDLVVPEGVEKVSDYAFFSASLESVKFSPSVTEIGIGAFYQCESLAKVSLSSGIKTIGRAAFTNCASLKELNIPYGVEEISEFAFNSCTSLKSITLPASVTSINSNALDGCSALEELIVLSNASFGFSGTGSSSLTVYAKADSPAKAYAESNGIAFSLLTGGDADGDGEIDISDLSMIMLYLSGEGELTNVQAACADINEDSTVDGFDMFYVDKAMNGLA